MAEAPRVLKPALIHISEHYFSFPRGDLGGKMICGTTSVVFIHLQSAPVLSSDCAWNSHFYWQEWIFLSQGGNCGNSWKLWALFSFFTFALTTTYSTWVWAAGLKWNFTDFVPTCSLGFPTYFCPWFEKGHLCAVTFWGLVALSVAAGLWGL